MNRFVIACVVAFALSPATGHAAFAGANGKIAYVDGGTIWTMNPDGSAKTQITTGVDAAPAWSPDGTRIAFHRKFSPCSGPCSDIWIANADGSNATLAIHAAQYPSWSPDGEALVFMADAPGASAPYGAIWRAKLDGTGRVLLYDHDGDGQVEDISRPAWAPGSTATIAFQQGTLAASCNPDLEECANFYPEAVYMVPSQTYTPDAFGYVGTGGAPNWSPNGGKLAFFTPGWGNQEFPGEPGGEIGVMNRDGSQRQLLTPGAAGPGAFDSQPAWAPDASRIVFGRSGDGIHVINVDGTGDTRVSATGTDPDWQALPVSSPAPYVRPKAAARIRVSLVPAYRACTTPNRVHGPPLAFDSCAPPRIESEFLALGGATDATAKAEGHLRLRVVPGNPSLPDDTDVLLRLSITNVRRQANLADHTGEVQGILKARITDRGGAYGPLTHGATMMDLAYTFAATCVATADTTVGSTCSVATSFDAIVPGSSPEGARSVWQLDRLEVRDAASGGRLLMTQGVFVP